MKLLLPSIFLPLVVLAQTGTIFQGPEVIGNKVGTILGIFAMCGTSPVDCGNGWCCLAGQSCTGGKNGANTMCYDPSLVSNTGSTGVVVNAAFFGNETSNQISPSGNGTSAPKTTTTAFVSPGAGAQLSPPRAFVLVSALVGSSAFVLSLL